MRTGRARGRVAAVFVGAGLLAAIGAGGGGIDPGDRTVTDGLQGPARVQEADTPPTLDGWTRHLAFMTGGSGVWITSNDAYRTADNGEPPAFGMAYEAVLGDVGARGCLWSILDDGGTRHEWDFLMGWDPGAGAPFLYQSSGSGIVASGPMTSLDGAESRHVQTFLFPSGVTQRIGHHSTEAHADTLMTRSLDEVDGEWQARRSYTWVRQPEGRRAPCL